MTPAAAARVSGSVDLAGQAAARGIEVILVEDVNDPGAVARIRQAQPDLVVVVGWTQLIRDELLAVPTHGCIGFHASVLPRNRGRAPVNWAILRGEPEAGNTLMVLDPGADTGLVVDQRSTPITPTDDCATIYARVAELGAQMLRDNLRPLLLGQAQLRAQDEADASVLPRRVPAMGVTDWTRTSRELHDWIRAQTHPYPGAYTRLHGRHVTLWASEVPDPERDASVPAEAGTVVALTPEGVRVGTGSGSMLVTRMGPADAPHTPAPDWAASVGLGVGAHFEQPPEEMVRWSLGHGPRPRELSPWA
nr:methionyl-tRNA formyltransferase [Ornithinimicrobium cryptoxanthini]